MSRRELTFVDHAHACILRCDRGYDGSPTMTQAIEAVEHVLQGLKRQQITELVAYLTAQIVGYQNSANRDATLVVAQIRRALDEYDRSEKKRATP